MDYNPITVDANEQWQKMEDDRDRDSPTEVLTIKCPYCDSPFPLVRDKNQTLSITNGTEFWLFRGSCSACSRSATLWSNPVGQAQKSYGKRWYEFWRRNERA